MWTQSTIMWIMLMQINWTPDNLFIRLMMNDGLNSAASNISIQSTTLLVMKSDSWRLKTYPKCLLERDIRTQFYNVKETIDEDWFSCRMHCNSSVNFRHQEYKKKKKKRIHCEYDCLLFYCFVGGVRSTQPLSIQQYNTILPPSLTPSVSHMPIARGIPRYNGIDLAKCLEIKSALAFISNSNTLTNNGEWSILYIAEGGLRRNWNMYHIIAAKNSRYHLSSGRAGWGIF